MLLNGNYFAMFQVCPVFCHQEFPHRTHTESVGGQAQRGVCYYGFNEHFPGDGPNGCSSCHGKRHRSVVMIPPTFDFQGSRTVPV